MKKHDIVIFILLCLLSAAVSGCVPNSVSVSDNDSIQNADLAAGEKSVTEEPDAYRLAVFETSDIHGYVVDTKNAPYEYRLSWIADKVQDARKRNGSEGKDSVILLDGGDIFQGNMISNLLDGEYVSEAFDALDYDAVTIGNHEFDWGIESVIDGDATLMDYSTDDSIEVNEIPVVMSNLYRNGEKVSFAQDYVILQKTAVNGREEELPVRIAVIGFAFNYASTIMNAMFSGAGYEIREDYDALITLAHELREKESCDAVILLTHSDASRIARRLTDCTEIDLVLGGHKHQSDLGMTEQGLVYMMPAGEGQGYCYAEMVFDADDQGNVYLRGIENAQTILSFENASQLYDEPENKEELDPDILKISNDAIEEVQIILDERIGYITVSSDRNSYYPESGKRASSGGNWYTSITARAVGADIAFYNQHGMRANLKLSKGADHRDVTVGDLFTLFPFNNHIYCYEITYEELLTLFEYALTEAGSDLLSVMSGIDCYYTDQTVHALVSNDEVLYANGVWNQDPKTGTVRVAANEYICTANAIENGMSNPLYVWKDTDRLIRNDVIDVQGAVDVLQEEAEENNGYLYIDTRPHFLNMDYPEQETE